MVAHTSKVPRNRLLADTADELSCLTPPSIPSITGRNGGAFLALQSSSAIKASTPPPGTSPVLGQYVRVPSAPSPGEGPWGSPRHEGPRVGIAILRRTTRIVGADCRPELLSINASTECGSSIRRRTPRAHDWALADKSEVAGVAP